LPTASEPGALARAPASAPPAAIDIDEVCHRYGDRVALDGVRLSVAPGELVALLGPNGGGKTTLFRILATLLRPTSGAVRVFGADTVASSHAVRARLGVVFQTPALDKRLTVRENLRHHGHLYGLRGSLLDDRLAAVLARVGMASRAGDLVLVLSGGLARRAEIAKALLPRPDLLLLDEPTTGLDPRARDELWRDLRRLRQEEGTTIVLTTHLMDEAAACDRVAILDHGRIVVEGRPGDLTAALGGDVITIEAPDADGLAVRVRQRFGLDAVVVDGTIRIEQEGAHVTLGRLVEAFPAEVHAIRYSRPTLHDVFVHYAGHAFD
jgi:ABC-2 type transport system ATP-binding protein